VLVVGIFHKEQTARLTVADTRAQLAALDARKSTLSATVHDLDTERGQEASMRETFGVAKPGEEVIVVVPKKDLPPPPSPTFWDKVKEFLHIR
jgi:cell division protein FtsB